MILGQRTLSSRRAQRKVAEFYPFSSSRHMNAAKREADRAVKHALYHGTLTKKPCEKCRSKKSEAHHEDYEKPLDVRWLCRFHHRRRDAELRDERRAAVSHIAGLPVAFFKNAEAKLTLPSTAHVATSVARRRSTVAANSTISLVRQATLEVASALDVEQVSEIVLSRRMKVSRQVINAQFASGFRTLKVLAAYADALGYDAVFVLRKRQESAVA